MTLERTPFSFSLAVGTKGDLGGVCRQTGGLFCPRVRQRLPLRLGQVGHKEPAAYLPVRHYLKKTY